MDDGFVVCGYIEKENNVISDVLGQYDNNVLMFKGHVSLGVSNHDFRIMGSTKRMDSHPFKELPSGS